MDIYSLFGNRVLEERQKAGLTQEELAEASSISTSFLAYIERGKKKASLETVKKLADGLKIPISDLFKNAAVYKTPEDSGADLKLTALLKDKSSEEKKTIYNVIKAFKKKHSRSS